MKKNQNEGFVLITTLVILVVLLGVSFALIKAILSELVIARSQQAGTVCFYLAEAGVEEAIWRIRNESGTRDKFLNSNDGLTSFTHDPGLVDGSSYSVQIQNSAPGTAEITSTGLYDLAGDISAQRMIKVDVAEAIGESPLDNVAGFTGGASGNEDIDIALANVDINGGSLVSNRDIKVWMLANVNVAKDVKAVRNIDVWPFSSLTVGGQTLPGIEPLEMPSVDFDSADPNSLKSQAQAQGQVYTKQQFSNLIAANPNLIMNGYVYVTGNVDIRPITPLGSSRSLTVNGVLAADGTITVGRPISFGTLVINHPEGIKSGVLSKQKLVIKGGGEANVNGVIYMGDGIDIDPSLIKNVTVNGGFYARRITIWGRNVNITYNGDYINEIIALPDPETPIIEIQHWEEEY